MSQAPSSCKAKLHILFAEKCSSCAWLDRVYPHNPWGLQLHPVHLSLLSWTAAMLGVLSASSTQISLKRGCLDVPFIQDHSQSILLSSPVGTHECHICVAFGCTRLERCPGKAPEPLELGLRAVVGPLTPSLCDAVPLYEITPRAVLKSLLSSLCC